MGPAINKLFLERHGHWPADRDAVVLNVQLFEHWKIVFRVLD